MTINGRETKLTNDFATVCFSHNLTRFALLCRMYYLATVCSVTDRQSSVCLWRCTLWPNNTSYSKSTKPVILCEKTDRGNWQSSYWWIDCSKDSSHTQLPIHWSLCPTSWRTRSEQRWRCTSGRTPTEPNPAYSKSLYRICNHMPRHHTHTASSLDITLQFTHN